MERGSALSWWRVFVGGFALWIASVVVTGLTGNFNLVPTVVLLGSFLVPVTAVLWYLDHYHSPVLTGRDVLNAFLVGGVLGVLGASILESWLGTGGWFLYAVVGLVEEGAKLAALLAVTWRLPHRSARDGIVMGAAVGFGFAALESSGYALTALFTGGHHLSLGALVGTELLRAVLAPFGHGLWTAILGGVLFASAAVGRLRISRWVVLTYVGVSLLHSLWDAMRGLAVLATILVTGTPVRTVETAHGAVLAMSAQQAQVYAEAELAGYAAISLIGIVWLAVQWRRQRPTWGAFATREVA